MRDKYQKSRRVRSLDQMETFKQRQMAVINLKSSGKERDGHGMTIAWLLNLMIQSATDIAFDYSEEGWREIEAKLLEDAKGDKKEFVRWRNALMAKVRDRLAVEINFED